MLLYYANPSFDFREITFKVNNFIYLCLLDEDIVQAFLDKSFGAVISMACIISALENLGMVGFREQLELFLLGQTQLEIDREDVGKCVQMLNQKIIEAMFQNQKKSPASLLKIKAPLNKMGGSKASSKKGSSEKSAKYREVLSLLSQNSASGKKQALPNLPKPGQITLSSGSGKENQIRQSRKQQISSRNEANISLLSEATIPHEIREFNLTSIKKTKRFSYHGIKNNNFDQLQLLKIVQAMGDKESFALIPGQSFLTNSVLQSSGVVSSANFQEREIEEMRNLRFPGNMSQSRFIIADKFVRGGPRMMGILGQNRVFGGKPQLNKFLQVFNEKANQVSTASCVDTPEIEEESPLKETENEEPMSPQIEYNLIDQRQLQAQQREFDSIRENLRGDGGNILSFFVTSFMPIPDEKVSQKRKQDRFEVRTGYTSMALPYNSVIRKTPGQSIFGNF
ncbi:hypothetical protein FGO68_gene7589 [Halteria grandinella]|uniref:Uncharacterized protein n=1 Tax=Halteria grandinella TaxID=5974 RepID=A0A8J8T3P9_HALGN|nr:hypothetical protein FGO68_gene7589 [Halteria grandinella]